MTDATTDGERVPGSSGFLASTHHRSRHKYSQPSRAPIAEEFMGSVVVLL